jgi:hypothetical protein
MTCLSRSALLLAICTSLVALLSAQSPTRVQHVAVLGSGQAIEVEIQASGAVVPQSQMITRPDRIVVDFPGALPAAELRTLNVNRGALKTIRAGLFSSNPPVTRVVLDLTEPQSYQIFSVRNVVMLKVGPVKTAGNKVTDASLALVSSGTTSAPPPKPPMEVTFQNGLLRIHTERATWPRSYSKCSAKPARRSRSPPAQRVKRSPWNSAQPQRAKSSPPYSTVHATTSSSWEIRGDGICRRQF